MYSPHVSGSHDDIPTHRTRAVGHESSGNTKEDSLFADQEPGKLPSIAIIASVTVLISTFI